VFRRRRRGSRCDDRRTQATSRSTGRDIGSPAQAPTSNLRSPGGPQGWTACRGLPTNERKRDASLAYARWVLGLRPCSHSLSNCSSLLAGWLAATPIPPSPTVVGERRIMALLTHSAYRNQGEVTRRHGVI